MRIVYAGLLFVDNLICKSQLIWYGAGPGCSSLGYGALQELGPFRVNRDNRTLSRNKHAWNKGNFLQRGCIDQFVLEISSDIILYRFVLK
ncbi:hypothetical protein ACC756_37815, partial [Rhizobium ruizarguesonis]